MNKIESKDLTFSTKILFLIKLRDHYLNKEGEYYYKKGLVFKLYINCVGAYFDSLSTKRNLTDEELKIILKEIFDKEYLNRIIDKSNPEQEAGITTGIGCIAGIIDNDMSIYIGEIKELISGNIEKKEEEVGGITFNTGIFDFYKDEEDLN